MSRIHEALKKAEQERWASLVDRKAEEPAEPLGSRQAVKIGSEAKTVLAPAVLRIRVQRKIPRYSSSTSCGPNVSKPSGIPIPISWCSPARRSLPREPSSSAPCAPGSYRIRESKPLSILLVSSATLRKAKHSYPRIWRRFWPANAAAGSC